MARKPKSVRTNTRLKVYMTQIGFHNWLVAAHSQKAALEAWDVNRNLFAMGAAQIVTDKAAVEFAMKTPGEPVTLDADHDLAKATRVLRLDDHRKHKKPQRPALKAKRKPAPRKKKADRTKLDRAERALDEFHRRAVRERSAILRAQKTLDLKAGALDEELDAEEARLSEAVKEAQDKYDTEVS
jgi:hypothetical protein